MITVYLFLVLIMCVHWVADFVGQTQWQAENKSYDPVALLGHIASYGIILFIGTALIVVGLIPQAYWGVELNQLTVGFVAVNILAHGIQDAITSRITSTLYAAKDYHNFFVVIGFDQLLHMLTFAATIWIFFNGFVS